MNTLFSSAQMRILAALTFLMAMFALGSYASLNFEKVQFLNPTPATISVTGEGEVIAKPDVGEFSFSVQAEAETAAVAQEESGTKVNAIIAYLQEQGIEEKDIKTQNYNLYPKYRWEQKICTEGTICAGNDRVQDGFTVSQSVRVKVRETKDAGAIIAGVGEREATNISGLNFTVDDPDELQAEARAAAIQDAKEKAGELAGQLGVRVVRLVGYSEGGGYYPQSYMARAATMEMDMAEESVFSGAEMPVGEESTTARVTLIYEVR